MAEYVEVGFVEDGYYQTGVTIDWANRIIFIPKFVSTQVQTVPSEIRTLDLNEFRLALKDLEDSDAGIVYPTTHNHNTIVEVGGVTLARVLELINNYTVTFEDGQYAINLTGANSNVADKVNVNQVSVRAANSAGLIEVSTAGTTAPTAEENATAVWSHASAIELLDTIKLLDEAVHIDTERPTQGDGSQTNPFNTLEAALDFAESKGLTILHVLSDIDIDRNLKNFIVRGIGTPNIDCGGHNLDKSEFSHCVMKGNYTGRIIVQESVLYHNFHLNGFFENSVLAGTLYTNAGSQILLKGCASFVAGSGKPIIDMSSGTTELNIRDYSGGLRIAYCTGVSKASLDGNPASFILDSSCTGGEVLVRGVATLVDNSLGTTVIEEQINNDSIWNHASAISLQTDISFLKGIEGGRWKIVSNQMVFYDSDNTTEIARFNLLDSSGTPTMSNVFERTRV